MSQKIKTSVEIDGSLKASQIANATTDTDKFLVSDSGTVKYRTGAEVLSDLGITVNTASKLQHQVKAGVAINKGQAVYVTSADGTNMIVGLASNASEATSSKTMGLLDGTVAINGFANVVTEGLLSGLSITGAVSEGDPVWLGTGGNLIYGLANKPSAPNHLVFIGIVTRVNANNGEIFVKVQNGFELNEIHDVDLKTTLPSGNDILAFEGAPVNLWKNKTIASVLGYTPYNASNPAGYISTYTETDTLASVTARGASTSTLSTFDGGLNIGNAKLRWGGTTSPTLGFPFTGGPNAFWIDVNDGDTGGLAIDNDGTTIYGAGDSGHVFRVIDEDVYQATSNVDASTTFRIQQGQNGGGYVRGNFEITGTLSASGYNKTNWDTAYGWGNHASAGYVPQARTITINGTSYDLSANRSWTVTASETDTLATVTGRGSTTSTGVGFNNYVNILGQNSVYWYNSSNTSYARTYFDGGTFNLDKSLWVTANIYGDIFYDRNNTGYYVDPASTSNLNIVRAANSLTGAWIGVENSSSTSGNGISLYGGASSGQPAYGLMFAGTATFGTHGSITSDWSTYFTMNDDSARGWIFRRGATNVASISGGGILQTSGYIYSSTYVQSGQSIYSPVYYDANDTAYYIDANNSSNLNILSANRYISNAINNTGGLALNNASTYWGLVYNAGANDWRLGYGASNSAVGWNLRWDNGGTVWANYSMRAPIFYDSDDTSYYGDFNSTTRQYQAISFGDSTRYSAINTTINGSGAGDKLILYGGTSNYDARLLVGADYDMLFKSQGNSAGKGSFKFYSGQNCNLAMTIDGSQNTSLNGGLSVAGGSSWFGGYGGGSGPGLAFENQNTFARIVFWGLDFYDWNHGTQMVIDNGYVLANNSMRSPTFYDSNNTGYYGDFASTSKLNTLILSALASDDGMIENNTGAYFHLGGWGVGRTAATAVLVNTAYRADIADNATNAGYATSSGSAGYLPTLYSGGQQLNPQTYFNNGIGLRVAMTAKVGYWSDTVWINGYSGGDVPWMCALHTQRNSSPRMYISAQQHTSGSYGTAYEFLTEYNVADYAVTKNTGQDITGIKYFVSNRNTTSDSCPLQAYSNNGSGATMSFHRGGYYAVNFGLDSDNVMRIGGWSAGANRWQLDMSGNMTVAGDVTAYSDIRVKENIKTIDSALDKVLSLRGVTYNRIDSEDKAEKIGVIAQEIQEVLPQVVHEQADGMLGVSYGNITAVLIEAIKEQQTQIEELKELVKQLTK